ncbi:hypothetical protein [Streptomyces sp. NPDC060333]|uniref:hypothetical protein n=1 Tax=Streptomyces sp. NPDC060333 TaxID=3347098 RepID=UPI00366608EB
MTAGVVVAVGLLLQVVAWQGQLGDEARAARATVDRVGECALVLRPRGATPEQLVAYAGGLPADVQVLALTVSPEGNRVTLRGRCPALRALDVACPEPSAPLSGPPSDRRLRELLGWYGERTGNVTVRQADPLDLTPREAGSPGPCWSPDPAPSSPSRTPNGSRTRPSRSGRTSTPSAANGSPPPK